MPQSLERTRCVFVAMVLALAACRTVPSDRTISSAAEPDSAPIVRDVQFLASDRLEGRGTGSPGNDTAAAYVVRRYEALHLAPPFSRSGEECRAITPARPRCESGFVEAFSARSIEAAHAGITGGAPTQNVAAIVRGTDPTLRNQYVILGAHFDHLGRSASSALDPEARDAIRNGADDNASGTAAVLELARLFARHPARRSIIVVNFSGEELGLLGSGWFVQHLPVPHDSVVAMLNFDMVGRLRDQRLIVYGTESATEWRGIVEQANIAPRFTLSLGGDGLGASDHQSFYLAGMPVLHFFTNVHDDYHKATDDADKINGTGIAEVVGFAERIARAVADRPTRLTFVQATTTAMPAGSREGSGASLGSVPDMGAADVKGVLLAGVRPGSPADRAGLRKGDVIVEFDGKPIADLYAFSDALNARKPGDTVTVVVLRDGQRVTVSATLGRR